MRSQDTPSATPRKQKSRASIARYGDGPQPRATIQHDIQATAYQRGATDALRSVMLAAQALLDKREPQS